MSAPVPGVCYSLDAVNHQWVAPGRESLSAAVPVLDRELLDPVASPYVPGITANTTGVRPGVTLVDVEANSSGNIILAPGTYTGKRFWGSVRMAVAGTVILRDCEIPGKDPRLMTQAVGAIHNLSPDRFFELYDCKLDGQAWNTIRGVTVPTVLTQTPGTPTVNLPTNAASNGLYGRNMKVYRCEIVGFQDLINIIGDNFTVRQSWAHQGWFAKGGVGSSTDGTTHADAIQMSYGKHYDIQYNLIGGARNADGENTPAPGYNSGDDCANSAFMIQQDVDASTDPTKLLEDVHIENNWIAGGTASVNLYLKNGNTLPDVWVVNNKVLRGQTTVASHGVRNDTRILITKPDAITSHITGNVIWDLLGDINGTGVPVPITRG